MDVTSHRPAASATGRLDRLLFAAVLLGVVLLCLLYGPFLTSDGPAHLGLANALAREGDPAWPLGNRFYAANGEFVPNLAAHLLMVQLIGLVPPLMAEQILQALCLLAPLLAGRLLVGRIAPGAGWLALFFLPVAFQKLFFIGLYNFCLSVSVFLLCLWAWIGVAERPRPGRVLLLAACLVGALLTHVMGWLEAMVAIGWLVAVEALMRLRRREAWGAVLRRVAVTAAAMLPGIALFLVFLLSSNGGAEIAFGADPLSRLLAILRAEPFGTVGRASVLAALALTATLVVLLLLEGRRTWHGREALPAPRQDLVLGLLGLPIVFLLIALVVPERAGGGWSHIWRAQLFPYIGLILAVAAVLGAGPRRPWPQAVAGAAALALFGAIALAQERTRPVLAEFAAVDRLVGPHCTVLPVIFEFRLDAANSARLVHHPLMHVATRLELRDDRVALYNYLARMTVHPVRYRPERNPHSTMYGWIPDQGETRILSIDLPRFEAMSGERVDYVLVWRPPGADRPAMWEAMQAGLLRDFTLVHRSASGWLELHARRPAGDAGAAPGRCGRPA